MNAFTTDDWRRYPVPELGLSLEFPGSRPVQTAVLEGTSYVFQNIPEVEGTMFLRFGPRETLEHFVPGIGDALTRATAGEPHTLRIGDIDAACVDLTLDSPTYSVHRQTSEGMREAYHGARRTRMSVCGFRSPAGVPVLIGYRMPERHLPEWRGTLDRFLQSPRLP